MIIKSYIREVLYLRLLKNFFMKKMTYFFLLLSLSVIFKIYWSHTSQNILKSGFSYNVKICVFPFES